MWKQVVCVSVEVLLDPTVPGFDPLLHISLDDSPGFGEPHHIHEAGHVANEIVVQALLIKDNDNIHLEK